MDAGRKDGTPLADRSELSDAAAAGGAERRSLDTGDISKIERNSRPSGALDREGAEKIPICTMCWGKLVVKNGAPRDRSGTQKQAWKCRECSFMFRTNKETGEPLLNTLPKRYYTCRETREKRIKEQQESPEQYSESVSRAFSCLRKLERRLEGPKAAPYRGDLNSVVVEEISAESSSAPDAAAAAKQERRVAAVPGLLVDQMAWEILESVQVIRRKYRSLTQKETGYGGEGKAGVAGEVDKSGRSDRSDLSDSDTSGNTSGNTSIDTPPAG